MEQEGKTETSSGVMIKGFVFGKFMPLHKGHLALLDFALQQCDHLYIVICHTETEPINGNLRKKWLDLLFAGNINVTVISFSYDETQLTNTSTSSRLGSENWANVFQRLVPDVNIIFTSEDYGDYVAEYMNIKHLLFDKNRSQVPISATAIRSNPFLYWDYIANEAKPWFIKKIALVGTESTGKSVLAERLARYFNTEFVPEMARNIIEKTRDCVANDLYKIAEVHAKMILSCSQKANKLLFVDTDLIITQSYSKFLFGKELLVEPWIEEANKMDLHLFLEPDCEFLQDGTRLTIYERNTLSEHHKNFYENAGIPIVPVNGHWEERFMKSAGLIKEKFFH